MGRKQWGWSFTEVLTAMGAVRFSSIFKGGKGKENGKTNCRAVMLNPGKFSLPSV